eukprot:1921688-Alexandrium_andersonii.AAC.1
MRPSRSSSSSFPAIERRRCQSLRRSRAVSALAAVGDWLASGDGRPSSTSMTSPDCVLSCDSPAAVGSASLRAGGEGD